MFDEKAVIAQRRVRKTDPDVYGSPDSARVRARQLGCIGIRRYATVDGGEAWMPCTNESDFRRSLGLGPQAKRDREKRERELIRRVVKTQGRAKSEPNSRLVSKMIELKSDGPKEDNRFIVAKVRNHNQEMKLAGKGNEFMATPSMLKKVWDKEIKMGSKEAMRRINIFLSVLAGAPPKNLRYISDISLLPDGHPRKSDVKISRRSFL